MFVMVGVWISPAAVAAVAAVIAFRIDGWWAAAAAAVLAACAVLAVLAAMRLARGAERRGVLATASWPVQRQLRGEVPATLPAAGAPAAIEQHVHYEVHYHPVGGELAPAPHSPYLVNRPAGPGVTSS